MCESQDYNYLSPLTIGGPSGNYTLICPIVSCRWCEFEIINIANGAGNATIFISGDSGNTQLVYDGSKTLNNDVYLNGIASSLPALTSQSFHGDFFRITNSSQKLHARIDASGGASCYITVRFRVKLLTVVPGPALSVHPDHQAQLNIARADATNERLKRMGIPMEVDEIER